MTDEDHLRLEQWLSRVAGIALGALVLAGLAFALWELHAWREFGRQVNTQYQLERLIRPIEEFYGANGRLPLLSEFQQIASASGQAAVDEWGGAIEYVPAEDPGVDEFLLASLGSNHRTEAASLKEYFERENRHNEYRSSSDLVVWARVVVRDDGAAVIVWNRRVGAGK